MTDNRGFRISWLITLSILLATLSIGIQQTFMDLVVGCWHQAPDHTGSSPSTADVVRDEMVAVSDDLIRLLTLPLGRWGLRALDELDVRERHSYFYHALGAYSHVVRRRTEGHRMADRSEAFSEGLERLADDEHARLRDRLRAQPRREDTFIPAPPIILRELSDPPLRPIADEIVNALQQREADPRIRWLSDGTARVLVGKIIPASGPQRTVADRRRQLRKILRTQLRSEGWTEGSAWFWTPLA